MVHLLHSVKRESPAEIQQSLLALGEELLLFLLSTQEGASQQSSAQVHPPPPTHTQRDCNPQAPQLQLLAKERVLVGENRRNSLRNLTAEQPQG